MDRRATCAILAFSTLAPMRVCAGAAPLLSWIVRVAAHALGRQTSSAVATATAATTARMAVTQRIAPALAAARASRAAKVLRELTVATLSTVAVDEVLAFAKNEPEDSVVRWTLAYYAVLTRSDSEAAMGMWLGGPEEKHFRHLDAGISTYQVHTVREVPASGVGERRVRVAVVAQNIGERPTNHTIEIDWVPTDHGYRIANFRSV
jgi:hypothetical protein